MSKKLKGDKPIYIQLAEQLKCYIVCGFYKAGEKLPTVRKLALEFNVNPNTMLKVLSILEQENLICNKTNARYVTKDNKIILEYKNILTELEINYFLNNLKHLGFSSQDISFYLLEGLEKN
jgi:GntR family transcriptional regulator